MKYIGSGLLVSESELIALMVGMNIYEFVGFEIPRSSISEEKCIEGINSLVRRGLLNRSGEALRLCDEYKPLFASISDAKEIFSLPLLNAIVYCGKENVLVRAQSLSKKHYSLCTVDAEDIVLMMRDENLLPYKDEEDIFLAGLPSDDEAAQILESGEGTVMKSVKAKKSCVSVLMYGLFFITIFKDSEKTKTELYSSRHLTEIIKTMLVGE